MLTITTFIGHKSVKAAFHTETVFFWTVIILKF